eukprot:3197020-Pyramimonas_sp.AAC.1
MCIRDRLPGARPRSCRAQPPQAPPHEGQPSPHEAPVVSRGAGGARAIRTSLETVLHPQAGPKGTTRN